MDRQKNYEYLLNILKLGEKAGEAIPGAGVPVKAACGMATIIVENLRVSSVRSLHWSQCRSKPFRGES